MDGRIPGPTSSAASPSRRSCSKLALPWGSFGLQKFEHDDVIAVRARGTKSPLPSSSRNQTIRRTQTWIRPNVRNGSKATIRRWVQLTSALPLKADIQRKGRHVSNVPTSADVITSDLRARASEAAEAEQPPPVSKRNANLPGVRRNLDSQDCRHTFPTKRCWDRRVRWGRAVASCSISSVRPPQLAQDSGHRACRCGPATSPRTHPR